MTTEISLVRLARKWSRDLAGLEFHTPSHVYNPLDYAWDGYHQYLERFGEGTGRVLLVGMNPGPWGMTQTGVPFGNISAVRGWFHIDTRLMPHHLPLQHEKYPILGMACHRDEGSGKRLWGWVQDRVGTPEQFFERFFVWNYCPLLFLAKNRNLIPGALKAAESRPLDALCDEALAHAVRVLKPAAIMGIGRYAVDKAKAVVGDSVPVGYLHHPSPANPTANARWPELAEEALRQWLPAP
ncbi:MAG: single-stranded DNA-binding protein [Nevskiaceae bacterium]|nr:MAG: single-stranded DNA-binding protein [Burkholderiaceae bacterium]TBR72363.1 MAG: single-stranded DNA-binding protein [Nevskiaceae bacterium]